MLVRILVKVVSFWRDWSSVRIAGIGIVGVGFEVLQAALALHFPSTSSLFPIPLFPYPPSTKLRKEPITSIGLSEVSL